MPEPELRQRRKREDCVACVPMGANGYVTYVLSDPASRHLTNFRADPTNHCVFRREWEVGDPKTVLLAKLLTGVDQELRSFL